MINALASRVPSFIVFAGIQSALWGFVYYQWQQPSELHTPLKSAIPKGHIGRRRYFQLDTHGHAI